MSRFGDKLSQLKDLSEMDHFNEKTPDGDEGDDKAFAVSHEVGGGGSKEAIKEALLTKFAGFAPNTSSSSGVGAETRGGDVTPPNEGGGGSPKHQLAGGAGSAGTTPSSSSSWLNQVKGRITRTVEEKYIEYRDKKQTNLSMSPSLDLDHTDATSAMSLPPDTTVHDARETSNLTHSCSEGVLNHEAKETIKQSQSFDDVIKGGGGGDNDVIAEEDENNSPPNEGSPTSCTQAVPITASTPSRARRRFPFPSFQLRSSPAKPDARCNSEEDLTGTSAPTGDSLASGATTTTTLATTSENSVNQLGTTPPGISNVTEPSTPQQPGASTPSGGGGVAIPSPSSTTTTPNRAGGLRARLQNFMGKSPAPPTNQSAAEPLISVSMKDLKGSPLVEEDPFMSGPLSGFGDDSDGIEEAVEIDEDFKFQPSTPEELAAFGDNGDVNPDSELAVEVIQVPPAEKSWFSPDGGFKYWWMAALPVCGLLLLQIFPFPSWVIGFITGMLIAGPLCAYLTWWFVNEDAKAGAEGCTPFIEDIKQKVAKKPAIIVQEELERKVTWMNLWPSKKGPYDPLTYDVRKTSSVRVMLHGPWIEMRFPKRNLPLRRMYDDREPAKVDYHDRVEVIDLSTCSIDLLPENLPSKRMWSKKYPIRIRTNTRKPVSLDSKKMAAAKEPESECQQEHGKEPESPLSEPKEANHGAENSNNNNESSMSRAGRQLINEFKDCDSVDLISGDDNQHLWEDIHTEKCDKKPEHDQEEVNEEEDDSLQFDDAKDLDEPELAATEQPVHLNKEPEKEEEAAAAAKTSNSFIQHDDPNKTFYLFTRTGREKEEWYNRFIVAANFMADWEHQNPKPGTEVDPDFETYKVKEQKFKLFMEDYFQAKNVELADSVHEETKTNPESSQCAKEQVAFLNIYFARMWHDLHDSQLFIDFLREKITKKLMKVKIAQYFDDVAVTTLDLGPKLPQILNASLPWQDELGLWVNLEVEYSGVCQATVETKGIRLPGKDEPDREAQELARMLSRQAAAVDSDEEDSAEEDDEAPIASGSDDDGDSPNLQPHAGFRQRMFDSFLKSEFVAKMAETEWVKKNITSRNITLQLQLHSVKGTLTLNFPPAPSDRIWYGFRYPPDMDIALRPCFGGQSLGKYEGTLSTVMRHLVKRLKQEIMKVLVYPNLDDADLPFLDRVQYSLGGSPLNAGTPSTDQHHQHHQWSQSRQGSTVGQSKDQPTISGGVNPPKADMTQQVSIDGQEVASGRQSDAAQSIVSNF